MDVLLGERTTEWWQSVARAQGAEFYLTSAITSNEDLGEMCLHGTGICSQQYRSFLW